MKKWCLLIAACTLTGCSSEGQSIRVIEREQYIKTEYSGVKACVGDLTPTFELSLVQENISIVSLGVSSLELEPEKVYVTRGEKVKEGQLLVSFKAMELEKNLEEKRNTIAERQLYEEHLLRLMEANPKSDFSSEIERLHRQNEVDSLYISEYEERIKAYQLISPCDGTVTAINSDLEEGFLTTTTRLISVAHGSGRYVATTREEYDFQEGVIFSAECDGESYDMKLVEVNTDTSGGKTKYDLIFEPLLDLSAISDSAKFTINVSKETKKNVVYIDKKMIRNMTGGVYVSIINDQGFIENRVIETGEQVDDFVIVTSGLVGDEEVVPK